MDSVFSAFSSGTLIRVEHRMLGFNRQAPGVVAPMISIDVGEIMLLLAFTEDTASALRDDGTLIFFVRYDSRREWFNYISFI